MVYAGNNLKSYTDSVFSALDWSLPVPQQFTLEQNYPNPFNPSTTIEYNLVVPGRVTLQVYDVLGRLVGTLVDGDEGAGQHQAKFTIAGHASGVYFYRLHVTPVSGQGSAYSKVMKMVLLR